MKKHESGWSKIVKKRKREEAAKVGARTLFDVGVARKPKSDIVCNPQAPLISESTSTLQIDDQVPEPVNQSNTSSIVTVTHTSQNTSDLDDFSEIPSDTPQEKPAPIFSSSNLANEGSTDIGQYKDIKTLPELTVAFVVRNGHKSIPKLSDIPKDSVDHSFPTSLLSYRNNDSKKYPRTWLVFSQIAASFYCLPCRLFHKDAGKGMLSSQDGWQVSSGKYQRLHDRVRRHEATSSHRVCFTNWKVMQERLKTDRGIDKMLIKDLKSQQQKWQHIFKQILRVVLFIAERGLAFRGTVEKIGDPSNGNFLGILELLAQSDPILALFLEKVRKSQMDEVRLKAHYLSPSSQNDFLSKCGEKVRQFIVSECMSADFFSILVDATPDNSHLEQQTFILRYLKQEDNRKFLVKEMFLEYVECSEKTGADIAKLILEEMKKHGLNSAKLRGQGYDNGSNMSGKFNGCQAIIKETCPYAPLSSCTLHSLNLVGVDSAQCCPAAITFFGSVQKVYVLFSSSPKRWEILKDVIGDSLHAQSETRWTARISAVKPFAAHLDGIKIALLKLNKKNFPSLKAANIADINGLVKYLSSFTCVLMSSIWYKVLKSIDIRNQIIQKRDSTLDVAFKNLEALLVDLKQLRERFEDIASEASLVAEALNIPVEFPELRQVLRLRRDGTDMSDKERFKFHVFYLLMDSVIGGITERFRSMNAIYQRFSFLWTYLDMDDDALSTSAGGLAKEYGEDLNHDKLSEEIISLRTIHRQTLPKDVNTPLQLLNSLCSLELEEVFPEIVIALKLFLTIPVSVASGERSFSHLNLIKSDIRSTMTQDRLNNLATLNMNCNVARKIDFSDIIHVFAYKQATRDSSFF